MRLLLYLATKKFAIKPLLRADRLQEKTRGNFLDKNKKGRRFYAAAFDKSRIFISVSFSLKFRK
jgi:hypothetical protein